ncbi:MAG TPA: hypothetical protein VJ571_04435 [Candidatus Nitrosotalea sp.]|nr:hypothetical protein [Candidatus Nitrosotalea sp.]
MNKKIIGVAIGAGAAIAIAVTFFVLLPQLQSGHPSIIQPANSVHNPKLGLVIMPPTQKPTLEEIRNAYAQAASTGIGRSNVYLSWPIMEPSQGTYNWGYSDILMGLNREQGLNVTLYFSVINNQLLGPFPSWMGKPQLDQKLQDQTVTTLDAILSKFSFSLSQVEAVCSRVAAQLLCPGADSPSPLRSYYSSWRFCPISGASSVCLRITRSSEV